MNESTSRVLLNERSEVNIVNQSAADTRKSTHLGVVQSLKS